MSMDAKNLDVMSNYELKLNVVEGMKQLMNDVSFEKLSVSDICKAANTSRSTFYRYFKDKYAVVQWHINSLFIDGVDEIGRTLSWYEGYMVTEATMSEYLEFYRWASRSDDRNAIDNYSPRSRRAVLRETVTKYKQLELTEQLRFEIDVIVEAETHLFPRWHNGSYDCSLEEICTWMTQAVPRHLFELLDEPVSPRKMILPQTLRRN